MEMLVREPLYASTVQFDKTSVTNPDDIRKIRTTRMDRELGQSSLAGPVLLKTDCQGHDLSVLRGATGILDKVDLIISEIPIYGPWGGGPELSDYLTALDGMGFRVYDIAGWLYRPDDERLHHLDVAFAKTTGLLRQKRLYTEGKRNLGCFAHNYVAE